MVHMRLTGVWFVLFGDICLTVNQGSLVKLVEKDQTGRVARCVEVSKMGGS